MFPSTIVVNSYVTLVRHYKCRVALWFATQLGYFKKMGKLMCHNVHALSLASGNYWAKISTSVWKRPNNNIANDAKINKKLFVLMLFEKVSLPR